MRGAGPTAPVWMIYGANGYTGTLIAEEAARRGLMPVLAGRREDAVRPLADRLGLEWRVFPLGRPEEVAGRLTGISAVLLAAGPFSETSRPVLEACLRRGVHYVDITGEIGVFEACRETDDRARGRGCVVLPGAGADVVPSDCLAAGLKAALPDAVRLEMAFASRGGYSAGTMKTAVESIPRGGAVRREGRIVRVPLAWKTAEVPFRDRVRTAVSISWGDVSTAYHSTGIPDIVVYMALSRRRIRTLRLLRHLSFLLRSGIARRAVRGLAGASGTGPGPDVRDRDEVQIWGRVTNGRGTAVEGTLVTPNGYTLTARTAVECAARVAAGEVSPGFHTPSSAFGARFIEEFPGCDLRIPR